MTYTDKILAEFDNLEWKTDVDLTDPEEYNHELAKAFLTSKITQALAEEREIKVDLKQILKEQANWKHPNFGIIAEFVSGLGENGVVNYKVIKNT